MNTSHSPRWLISAHRASDGLRALVCALACAVAVACGGEEQRTVVVYTALDRAFSEPIFEDFTAATGIVVKAAYDTESTKTIGLTNRLRAERRRPRCDVFWNNEILNTLRLKDEGLLSRSDPAGGELVPAAWKDPDGYWYGFAARARVLLVNTELLQPDDWPHSLQDLCDPALRGRVAMAKPLFGTTASHFACLYVALGAEGLAEFTDGLLRNEVQIHGGNKGAAVAVSEGRALVALTDTDDAIIEVEAGRPVAMVSLEGELGTLFLPNTLCVVAGAPHPVEAGLLMDYLLSAEVEARLAAGPSAQIPILEGSMASARVKGPGEVKAMVVDFAAAAAAFETVQELLKAAFLK